MASAAENEIAIAAIQTELAASVKLSELSDTERRALMDAIFPEGAALHYLNETIVIGDLVYGKGIATINSGNLWFGESLVNGPITGPADVDLDIG